MAANSQLLELANALQTQVAAIHEHLVKTGQPDPSFDGQAPDTDYDGIDDTRSSALENLTNLVDLLSTPREILHSRHETDMLSRHFLDRFNVYSLIPVGETRTYTQIAEEVKLPAPLLRRIVRHAMSQRIFCEPETNVVAHTNVSRLLAQNSKVRDYQGIISGEVWPGAVRAVDAIQRWPGSRKREESGYVLARGQTIQQTLDQNREIHARYDNAMGAYANDRSFGYEHVVKGFDWAALGEATMVDVGGGVGNASKALAKSFPSLNFIVEDRAEVIANATIEDSEIRPRIRFLEHDFFAPQPIKDADVYFFRRVFMEWEDEDAIRILQALKSALKIGARVMIQDTHSPEPGAWPLWQDRRFRASDLRALAIANGGQRELDEWQGLFERAGTGFEFRGVEPVQKSEVVFAHAVWRGESEE